VEEDGRQSNNQTQDNDVSKLSKEYLKQALNNIQQVELSVFYSLFGLSVLLYLRFKYWFGFAQVQYKPAKLLCHDIESLLQLAAYWDSMRLHF